MRRRHPPEIAKAASAGPVARGAAHLLRALAGLSMAAAGCVTVNVYFPAAEVEEAADVIVGEVRPDGEPAAHAPDAPAPAATSPGAPAPKGPVSRKEAPAARAGLAGRIGAPLLACLLASPAAPPAPSEIADGPASRGPTGLDLLQGPRTLAGRKKIDLNISTPLLRRIRASLKARYPKLLPFYRKGTIGEAWDGKAAIRTLEGLARREVAQVRALVTAENRDRHAMYRELARANGIRPADVPRIARIFGKAFIEKLKPGLWYRDSKGRWREREAGKKPVI